MAIADPVRYHGFFRRYLPHLALVDLRVGAVTFDIDLGRDWRRASTDFLENVAISCLVEVAGIAGSNFERCEFRLQRVRWIATAGRLLGD